MLRSETFIVIIVKLKQSASYGPRRTLHAQPGEMAKMDGGMDGGWRDDNPVRKCHGNIRQCCVFLHNKCPSTRQSHLKRVICLSSPLAKRLRLYQWGHDEFSADTHSVWALSEHAFKWTLSSSASYYTRISKLSLLSSTTSNTITTTVLALLHPLPSIFYLLLYVIFSSDISLSWSTSPKTSFICYSWWTDLHFFFLKHLTSYPSLLLLSIKPQRVWSHHS